jgi:hypothetical protein
VTSAVKASRRRWSAAYSVAMSWPPAAFFDNQLGGAGAGDHQAD